MAGISISGVGGGAPGPQGPAGQAGQAGQAGPGVPSGGTTGQVLTKQSGIDFATAWVAPGGSPDAAWPIGSVFTAVVATSPATLLGFGTWSRIAAGRVLIGQDAGDVDFDTAEEAGGEKAHVLTAAEMPAHTHVQDAHTHVQNAHTHVQNAHQHGMAEGTTDGSGTFMDRSSAASAASAVTDLATAVNQNATATNQSATATNQSAGGGSAHNNVPPYLVVYFWKRTA